MENRKKMSCERRFLGFALLHHTIFTAETAKLHYWQASFIILKDLKFQLGTTLARCTHLYLT